jgi:ComF family protein
VISPVIKESILDLLHLFYPHLCAGCQSDVLSVHDPICPICIASLPETGFENITENPVEKTFYGRIHLKAATSSYYFSKGSALQHIIHALKYEKNQKAGLVLGRLLGSQLKNCSQFREDYLLVPVPMHPGKEKQRGYNQAAVIAKGIHEVTTWPLCEDAVLKLLQTTTQTKKGRNDRWENIRDGFKLNNAAALENKHILLIDDVLTTGATLEACGQCIFEATPASLSVATIAWAGGI